MPPAATIAELRELYRDASVRLDEQRRLTDEAEANLERLRERLWALADSWTGSRSDIGPVTRAHGAQLRAALAPSMSPADQEGDRV